jgi:hypothetical protein
MRSILPCTLALLGTAGLAPAVAAQNLFEIYNGACTDFTSRGIIAGSAGDYLLQVPATHFAGVGHDAGGSSSRLTGFTYFTQDQNGATPETYSVVVRGDVAGAPDCSAAGLLLSVPLMLPAAGIGVIARQITTTLATPSSALPLCQNYYMGLELAAAPGWSGGTDGQSLHLSDYFLGDNPAAGVPSLSWNCLNGMPQQPTFFETLRIGASVDAALLNMGNVDPTLPATRTCLVTTNRRSFGAGGLWPACGGSRADGVDCRVRDRANANGVFVLFLGTALSCPGLPLSGLANGALYLNPGGVFLQLTSGALNSTGEGTASVIPPGSPACARAVNRFVDFQAFTLGSGFALPGNLTNRVSVNYR